MGQESSVDTELIVIGRIGAPFGIKGWAHVQSFTHPSENILRYKKWYFKTKDHWQSTLLSVLQIKPQGKSFVAALKGYDTREAIAALTQSEIGIPREALPVLGKDEYYWHDLIGLAVINDDGSYLGQVESLLETGSNDVLVIKKEDEEHLVPYIMGETILKVDLLSRTIYIAWDINF